MKIIVLGGGVAGLAAACRQAAAGHDVTLLEKINQLGGKISIVTKGGYTWDGGPSFFTDPMEFDRLFTDCGKKIEDYFTWIELNEACRYFYKEDMLRGFDSPERLAEELERVFSEPKDHAIQFLKDVNQLYNAAGEQFLNEPVTMSSFLSLQTVNSLRNLPKKSISSSLHKAHDKYFATERTVQFFDRFATYVGGNPYKTPGLLMAMPHLEHNQGAVHPVGGMRSIISAATQLARDLGVNIKMNQEITKIETKQKKVSKVFTKDNEYEVDVLIQAADVANFYKMTNLKKYKKHAQKEHSLSGYVQYFGVSGKTKDLYLHNILFSGDYEAETKALWNGKVYADPTVYINNTSVYEPGDAPEGCENWFVMVNIPAGFDKEKLPKLQSSVMKKLEKQFSGLQKRIKVKAESLTPATLEQKFNAFNGSIYGLAANSIRGAFLRPANKDKNFKNVYHVGVTVHPGGGIPLALRSARIVSKMIGYK